MKTMLELREKLAGPFGGASVVAHWLNKETVRLTYYGSPGVRSLVAKKVGDDAYEEIMPDTIGKCYDAALSLWARSGAGGVVEITEAAYYDCLGTMPPVYDDAGRAWVCEAYTHTDEGAWSLEYWRDAAGKCFCRISLVCGGNYWDI